jgi:FTR1 family protein
VIGAMIIVLREVFEAALIIGIVLAGTRGVARRGQWVVAGVAAGLLGAVIVAAFADRIAGALEGVGQEIFNAGVLLAATMMLGWHNVWMKRHGAELARRMHAVGRDVTAGASPLSVLLLAVGLAVLREGSEVVLFLYGIAAGGTAAAALAAGSLLGLVLGVAIGAAVYLGLLSIPSRQLFTVTGWLLLLLAAGMAAQAAGFLVQAGKLPALAEPVWDSSAWLPERGVAGQALHALVGYAERPSGMQVVFFAVVALGLATLMRLIGGRSRAGIAGRPAGGAVLLAAAASGLSALAAPPPVRAVDTVYSPIIEQGERALELRGYSDFDSARAHDRGAEHKLEFEYAPLAYWKTEAFVAWARDPGGPLRATELAWENIFQLTAQGQYWADLGALVEYAHALPRGNDDALELALLGEKAIDRSVLTVNLRAARALTGGAPTELEYAARWRWRWREALEPGVELHGGLGQWRKLGSLRDHAQQAGPAFFGRVRTGDRARLHYEGALLGGLTHESPDLTARLQLEYEF